jgi:hypothetical protein
MIKNTSDVKVINLTDHAIKLYPYDSVDIKIPVSKKDEQQFLARCITIAPAGHAKAQMIRDTEQVTIKLSGSKRRTSISYTHVGDVNNLPEEQDDTILIVSQLAYNSIHHTRKDVYIVDKPIRSESGAVLACRSFSRCVYDKDNSLLNPIENFLRSWGNSKASCIT